jgi:hypothetical protein
MMSGSLLPALDFAARNLDAIVPLLQAAGTAMLFMAAQQIPRLVASFASLIAANKSLIVQTGLFVAAFMVGHGMMQSSSPVIKGVGGAITGLALAIGIAKIATDALNVSLWSNPLILIGAALVGIIVGVAGALGAFGDDASDAAQSVGDMSDQIKDMQQAFDDALEPVEECSEAIKVFGRDLQSCDEIERSVRSQADAWHVNALEVRGMADRFVELMDEQDKTKEQQLEYQRLLERMEEMMPGFKEAVEGMTTEHRLEKEEIYRLCDAYVRLAMVRAEAAAIEKTMSKIYEEQYALMAETGMLDEQGIKDREKDIRNADYNIDYYQRQIEALQASKIAIGISAQAQRE